MIPFLCICPEENIVQKDRCTSVFTAALFTTAKTWKQPKCPLSGGWIKKMQYLHTMEYYSAIKKNEIMPFAATWKDLYSNSPIEAPILWLPDVRNSFIRKDPDTGKD